ncbi:MAG TPA: pseudouridine synthase [Myxococcota bacterium]|nr:pseudouridine synthase [Myxococcota bacterium]
MIERIIVPALEVPARLDRFCAVALERIPSRAFARKVIKRGGILLNGETVESSRFVREGDEVVLVDTGRRPARVFETTLQVLFEDRHLAVVDKPAGIPTSGLKHRTLEHALPANLEPSTEPDALERPRVVHRLDVRTQGLVICAKTASAQVALGRLFEQRLVSKRYRALLLGALAGEGIVDSPVAGRTARTRWRAVTTTPSLTPGALTTVDLWPETGRTHQLRRHMASLGHPILGDEAYTSGKVLRRAGLFLAAIELGLPHPVGGNPLRIERSEPDKFTAQRRRERRRFMRHDAVRLLADHEAVDELEAAHLAAASALCGVDDDACSRSHFEPGHFTASAMVLSPDERDVLLIHHQKLGRWLQPGGHIEPSDTGFLAAARREVLEETGIADLDVLGLLDVDVHAIPAREPEPRHEHHDLRFLFRAHSRAMHAGDGATDARWFPLDGVDGSDESVYRAIRKIIRRRGGAPAGR